MSPQYRKHHRRVGHDIARQPRIEDRQSLLAIAVINPVLGGELDPEGALDGAEGDLMGALAILDRGRKQGLVTHILFVVYQLQLTLDARQFGVDPHGRRVSARIERVGHVELGVDRSGLQAARQTLELVAEPRLTGPGHWLAVRHRDLAAPVQTPVQLPEIAPVLLSPRC